MRHCLSKLIVGAGLAAGAEAISVEQNYTICNWSRLRAGAIRDAIYLDGGLLWWQTAFADGTTPVVSSDGNAAGDMFRLNLSAPFDTTSTNLSALLDPMPKAGGAGNNIAPNYIDGAMMVNYDELYLYGGLPRLTDSTSAQSANSILGYEVHQYGPNRESWSPGFYQGDLSEGVTRYITNGAGVSAPSENLAFYFGGMRSPDWGPIYYEDSSANVTADTLITVDMSIMRGEKWFNDTLPSSITSRADAELIWLPVSRQGALIAIGGVTVPEEIWAVGLNDSQSAQSRAASPSFMTSIPIYDIASKQWFLQNTTGDMAPPQLTEFCSVVATSSNRSSFNIYIYGGYDGLNAADEPSDDVWILSLPAFTWTKAYSGISSHGRSGHRCISPYPDKMFVIGGMHQNQASCVEGGFIQVFNLNTLEFQDVYNPSEWMEYKQPSIVSSSHWNSKRQAVWSDPELEQMFNTPYSKESNIQHFYPYKSDNTTVDTPSSGSGNGSGKSHTIIIAVAVAAGIVALMLLIVALLIVRRRHILKSSTSETSSTKRSRISRWVLGTRPSPTPLSKGMRNESSFSLAPEVQQVNSYHSDPISDTSTTPMFRTKTPSHHRHPNQHQREPSEMSAAVERPLPPFELATPYNNSSHPRTSGVVNYAYDKTHGHSPHNSQSSTSSDYDQNPVEEHSPLSSTAHLHHDTISPQELTYHSKSTSSTSSTVAWPLPATSTHPTWSRRSSDHTAQPHNLNLQPPVPSMPPQYRSISSGEPERLRPILRDEQESANSSNSINPGSSNSTNKISSISSETDPRGSSGLPSPETSLSQGGDYRQSLMSTISPVSPDEPSKHWSAGSMSTRYSMEGREGWWRR